MKKNNKKIGKYHYAAMIFINLLVWTSVAYSGKLMLNITDSNPHYLFYLDRENKEVKRHDYISFEKSIDYLFNGEKFNMHKQVACIPGDTLIVRDDRRFFCNGELMGKAKTHSLEGYPVKHFKFNGKIPEGHYFTLGQRYREEEGELIDDSWDSRYYGFILAKEVIAIAKPII